MVNMGVSLIGVWQMFSQTWWMNCSTNFLPVLHALVHIAFQSLDQILIQRSVIGQPQSWSDYTGHWVTRCNVIAMLRNSNTGSLKVDLVTSSGCYLYPENMSGREFSSIVADISHNLHCFWKLPYLTISILLNGKWNPGLSMKVLLIRGRIWRFI
jgi:hypothetical protein